MTDDRQEQLSITLTREQWDAMFGGKLSHYVNWQAESTARGVLEAVVRPGIEDRYEAAKRESAQAVPVLTDALKRSVREQVKVLLRSFEAGTLKVDHLGCPATVLGGFAVSIISGGGSAFHFRYARELWFDRKPYPLAAEDKQWFVDTVAAVVGLENPRWWNDAPAPWVSVQFR